MGNIKHQLTIIGLTFSRIIASKRGIFGLFSRACPLKCRRGDLFYNISCIKNYLRFWCQQKTKKSWNNTTSFPFIALRSSIKTQQFTSNTKILASPAFQSSNLSRQLPTAASKKAFTNKILRIWRAQLLNFWRKAWLDASTRVKAFEMLVFTIIFHSKLEDWQSYRC